MRKNIIFTMTSALLISYGTALQAMNHDDYLNQVRAHAVRWDQRNDDANQDTAEIKRKRNTLLEVMESRQNPDQAQNNKQVAEFLKKYYRDSNNPHEMLIYKGKSIVQHEPSEGMWAAPHTMRAVIGLLSSKDVETVFDAEGLHL